MVLAAKPRFREISETDIDAIADLLTRGFVHRPRQYWMRGLQRQGMRILPAGVPRYGYMLDNEGAPVGCLLLIYATKPHGGEIATFCNVSSWYVDPAFRSYAPMLVSQALRHKEVTYTNVSAAPHTWPIIEAQGFSRYSNGIFISLPALTFGGEQAEVYDARRRPAVSFDPFEQETLTQHAAHGCISIWCATAERAYPFVFRPRLVKGFVPCAQLIYCRDIADFGRFAGPIGRYLALRGRPVVIVDANEPIPGLVGVFRRGSKPKYFKGPQRPRLGDLAYTEYAILGV